MKTLMHICCAPCSVYCIESLRAEGIEPVGFWYNPTIHPYTEYRSRRDCLRDYAQQVNLTLIEQDEYGLRDFVRRGGRTTSKAAELTAMPSGWNRPPLMLPPMATTASPPPCW